MLQEVLAASVLVGALLVVCTELLTAASARRLAADQRNCALLELGNAMERATARPWDELTPETLARERLSAWAERRLPAARLTIEVAAEGGPPNAKRITAAIQWEDRARRQVVPQRLTAWKYRSGNR
jgi:hypothetical protein